MRTSTSTVLTSVRSRVVLASLLGLSLASVGCFRSRMLGPHKGTTTTPQADAAPPERDAIGDGPRADNALPDGPRDGKADAGDAGVREVPGDARADGGRDGTGDLLADSVRDARLDRPSDRGADTVVCGAVEICGNGTDDDCNGLSDCKDPACMTEPSCIDRKKETCDNGIDDDDNGLIDCNDPACFGDKACTVPGKEVCNNNLDDDEDGLVDCKDPDCASDPTCKVTPGDEICDNGRDDNGDGLADCSDPKCVTFPACLQAACVEDVDFGTIASAGDSKTRTVSTVGATASYSTCAPPGGVARVAGFSLAAAADVRLDFTQDKGSAHVVSLFRAGVGQACDQNLVKCLDAGDKATTTTTYLALDPGSYWLVVQSYPGTTGSTTVTLSTGTAGVTEICDNGIDDDKDGAIDCADLGCASSPGCNLCVADINLGTLVVGGPSRRATVDTTKGKNRYHPYCAGSSDGNDIVVQFSVKDETVGITIDIYQISGQHIYQPVRFPPQGKSCDSDAGASGSDCPSLNDYYTRANWTFFEPGDYLLIFKASAAGKEGTLSITLTPYANRGKELCDNGIDDDGDQLVDCADPDCYGVPSCTAPMCVPDGDLGDLDVGSQVSAHADLTAATQVYKTGCGQGSGHGRAYRINLLHAMNLHVRLAETGDQVWDFLPQTSPLDACDANALQGNCVDPNLPGASSNFLIGPEQPGVYYVIVQAFSSGGEGTMDMTLLGEDPGPIEICNNGIDDDGDGAIDCNDRKCANDVNCQKLECQPDEDLGLLPLDGSILTKAIDTSTAGDDQHQSACASGSGGQDAVVGFELPGTTDLTIGWLQFGNHALVLYQADVVPLPCEANKLLNCAATAGATTGSYLLRGLAAGKYYLVVDADKAGSEGGTILQISGLPSE